MGKHNRDYKSPEGKYTHGTTFVVHFGPSGAIERFLRFSTCLEGKDGSTFFFLIECRTYPKNIDSAENLRIRRTAKVHEVARSSPRGKATVTA